MVRTRPFREKERKWRTENERGREGGRDRGRERRERERAGEREEREREKEKRERVQVTLYETFLPPFFLAFPTRCRRYPCGTNFCCFCLAHITFIVCNCPTCTYVPFVPLCALLLQLRLSCPSPSVAARTFFCKIYLTCPGSLKRPCLSALLSNVRFFLVCLYLSCLSAPFLPCAISCPSCLKLSCMSSPFCRVIYLPACTFTDVYLFLSRLHVNLVPVYTSSARAPFLVLYVNKRSRQPVPFFCRVPCLVSTRL